jgi:hypothetical protein
MAVFDVRGSSPAASIAMAPGPASALKHVGWVHVTLPPSRALPRESVCIGPTHILGRSYVPIGAVFYHLSPESFSTASLDQRLLRSHYLTRSLIGIREHIHQCRGFTNAQCAQQARRHGHRPRREEGEHTPPTSPSFACRLWRLGINETNTMSMGGRGPHVTADVDPA